MFRRNDAERDELIPPDLPQPEPQNDWRIEVAGQNSYAFAGQRIPSAAVFTEPLHVILLLRDCLHYVAVIRNGGLRPLRNPNSAWEF